MSDIWSINFHLYFKIRPEKYLNSYSIHKISNSPLNNFLQIKIFIECLSVHRIDQFSLTYYIKFLAEKYQPFPNATNSYSTILKISFFHPPQILSRSVPRTNFKLSPSFFFFFENRTLNTLHVSRNTVHAGDDEILRGIFALRRRVRNYL